MRVNRQKKAAKLNAAQRRAQKHQSSTGSGALDLPDGVSFFKLEKEGTKVIEILPYKCGKRTAAFDDSITFADPGEEYFERTFFVHRSVGPAQQTYVCPARTFGKRCPICEFRAKEMKKSDGDEKLIKDLNPKEQQLFNVLDHADLDKGVQLWQVSYHNFGKVLDSLIKNADADDDFLMFYAVNDKKRFAEDARGGRTLKMTVEQENFAGTKFYKIANINFRPRKTAVVEEHAGNALALDEIVKELDYDTLKKLFLGAEDETSSRSSKSSKSKRQAVDEDDDDELEDELEDDDDELEEGSELEDEDEDEDELEDESELEDDEDELEDASELEDDEDELEDESELEDEDDEFDDDEEEEEEEEPAPKKRATKKAPVKRATKKTTKKAPVKKRRS